MVDSPELREMDYCNIKRKHFIKQERTVPFPPK